MDSGHSLEKGGGGASCRADSLSRGISRFNSRFAKMTVFF